MIDFFRKYVSIITLILIGLFLLDLTNTDKEDLYVMEQTEIQSTMSLEGDEFDDDDVSDYVLNGPLDGLQWRCDLFPVTTIGEEQNENLCSAALRLGQVRRYAPRKNIAYSNNYINTKKMKDGADFGSDHLFLSHNSFIYQLKSN